MNAKHRFTAYEFASVRGSVETGAALNLRMPAASVGGSAESCDRPDRGIRAAKGLNSDARRQNNEIISRYEVRIAGNAIDSNQSWLWMSGHAAGQQPAGRRD
jgi:hypothetical protein